MIVGTLELKSPLTKEDWDKLADVELENSERIWFTTPSEKRVEYIKADVLDKIKAEIERKMELKSNRSVLITNTYMDCLQIIDNYAKG